jgi:hypothetical protein
MSRITQETRLQLVEEMKNLIAELEALQLVFARLDRRASVAAVEEAIAGIRQSLTKTEKLLYN